MPTTRLAKAAIMGSDQTSYLLCCSMSNFGIVEPFTLPEISWLNYRDVDVFTVCIPWSGFHSCSRQWSPECRSNPYEGIWNSHGSTPDIEGQNITKDNPCLANSICIICSIAGRVHSLHLLLIYIFGGYKTYRLRRSHPKTCLSSALKSCIISSIFFVCLCPSFLLSFRLSPSPSPSFESFKSRHALLYGN